MAESCRARRKKLIGVSGCSASASAMERRGRQEGQAGGETTQTGLHRPVNLAQLIPVRLVRQLLPMHLA